MVNVTFTENETYLLEYADSQGSFTSYVKRLIKEDMKKNESNNTLDLLLKRSDLINLITGNKEITATLVEQEPEQVEPPNPVLTMGNIDEMLEAD